MAIKRKKEMLASHMVHHEKTYFNCILAINVLIVWFFLETCGTIKWLRGQVFTECSHKMGILYIRFKTNFYTWGAWILHTHILLLSLQNRWESHERSPMTREGCTLDCHQVCHKIPLPRWVVEVGMGAPWLLRLTKTACPLLEMSGHSMDAGVRDSGRVIKPN